MSTKRNEDDLPTVKNSYGTWVFTEAPDGSPLWVRIVEPLIDDETPTVWYELTLGNEQRLLSPDQYQAYTGNSITSWDYPWRARWRNAVVRKLETVSHKTKQPS